jgi:hypothetical protein
MIPEGLQFSKQERNCDAKIKAAGVISSFLHRRGIARYQNWAAIRDVIIGIAGNPALSFIDLLIWIIGLLICDRIFLGDSNNDFLLLNHTFYISKMIIRAVPRRCSRWKWYIEAKSGSCDGQYQ